MTVAKQTPNPFSRIVNLQIFCHDLAGQHIGLRFTHLQLPIEGLFSDAQGFTGFSCYLAGQRPGFITAFQ